MSIAASIRIAPAAAGAPTTSTDSAATERATHGRLAVAARWAVTLAATAVSTLVLDAVATAVGIFLAASRVFDGAPRSLVLGFLAGSYLLWAAGLRVNLAANSRLLEDTGTSTNALSKAAFELVRRRSSSQRALRAASAAGYVVIEIAKEAPYYAGAFGAALLTDAVDSTHALVFLAGTNIGAGVYEYGLARMTRSYLAGDTAPRSAPAADRTSPRPIRILRRRLGTAGGPDRPLAGRRAGGAGTIAFFVDALRRAEPDQPVLPFGVGPTLHHVFLTGTVAAEIHLAEYLPANLREIERWLAVAPDAHDWRPFVGYTLECEGVADPTQDQVRDREDLVRAKITRLLRGDARSADPLGGRGNPMYDTVISAYCADSATADTATWESYMRHIAGLVRPGGLFVTAALRRSTGYVVGGRTFPAHASTSQIFAGCSSPSSTGTRGSSRYAICASIARRDTRASCWRTPAAGRGRAWVEDPFP